MVTLGAEFSEHAVDTFIFWYHNCRTQDFFNTKEFILAEYNGSKSFAIKIPST